MVLEACTRLGVDPARCVLVGDISVDVAAARAAGASGWLVPTAATRSAEVLEAPRVAATLDEVVDHLLGGDW
jgi:beta-phosphoglucomutase-like phosphatase (HAD superfamily)